MYAIYFRHWFAGADVPQQDAVFGIPFVLGTVVLAGIIAYLMFGKMSVTLRPSTGVASWLFHWSGGGGGPIEEIRLDFAVDAIRLRRFLALIRVNEVDPGLHRHASLWDAFGSQREVRFGTWS